MNVWRRARLRLPDGDYVCPMRGPWPRELVCGPWIWTAAIDVDGELLVQRRGWVHTVEYAVRLDLREYPELRSYARRLLRLPMAKQVRKSKARRRVASAENRALHVERQMLARSIKHQQQMRQLAAKLRREVGRTDGVMRELVRWGLEKFTPGSDVVVERRATVGAAE